MTLAAGTTPDGERLLLDVPVTTRSSVGFSVILNWPELTNER